MVRTHLPDSGVSAQRNPLDDLNTGGRSSKHFGNSVRKPALCCPKIHPGKGSEMAEQETAALIAAMKSALSTIPEVHRKAALKHASEAVWAELIDQSEHAKAASREAPPELGAKAAAATAAIQELAGQTLNPKRD
jgi:hypothetical protein